LDTAPGEPECHDSDRDAQPDPYVYADRYTHCHADAYTDGNSD
jgi:hypothetical protein